MLKEITVPAWRCVDCGYVMRSKERPRRCTNPGCRKTDQPVKPWGRAKAKKKA